MLRLANHGPIRFGALKREVTGISSRMLTERLRMLESKGFVTRDYHPTVPPEVYYNLSERGCEMRNVLGDIEALAKRWNITDT